MIAAYLCLSAALLLPAQAAPEEAVVAGQKAIDRWWDDYPWYNDAADDVRPIDVSEPWYTRLQWKWKSPSWSGGGGGWSGNTILEWIAWIVILLLLGVLIYVMIRVIRARTRRHSTVAGEEAEADPEAEHRRVEALPLPARQRPGDLLSTARQLYQEGNYREAILYLFSHQLVELDKRQFIHLDRGKTNRQYLRELGRRVDLRRLMEPTMVAFEEVFFGNHSLDRRRFEACWARLGDFDRLLAEGGAEA